MIRLKPRIAAMLIALAALMLAACGEKTAEANTDLLIRNARIQEVSVIFLQTYPVRVVAEAKGYLPDGCTSIREIKQARDGRLFSVTITTSRPKGAICTMAIREFKELIQLETTGLAPGAYRVEVNAVGTDFNLP